MAEPASTADQLLDAAQDLVQRRGYNAFSYKDLAREVGIRTASIHYHFETKADLGRALMERYLGELETALDAIDRRMRTQRGRLKGFVDLYRQTETRGAICLCGSLAADRETLPETVQRVVSAYLERCESWAAAVIGEGVRAGEFRAPGGAGNAAATLVAGLQGALIVGRAGGRSSAVDGVERTFLASLSAR